MLLSSPFGFRPDGFRIPQTLWDFEAYAKAVAFPGEALSLTSALLSGQSVLDSFDLGGVVTVDTEGGVDNMAGPRLLTAGDGYLFLHLGRTLWKIGTG